MTATASVRTGHNPPFPSELTGMVPRDVQLTASGFVIVALICAILLGGVASAIVMSIGVARTRQARERAAIFAQTVFVEQRRGEHPRRTISYRFEVDGRSFEGRTRLRERDRREVVQGGPIHVEYIVTDPAVNWVSGYEPGTIRAWAVPLVSGLFFVTAGGMAWRLRRQWILLSEGRVAQARVTGQKKVHRDKHTVFVVTCEFRDLSGAVRTMHYDASKAPPPVGTPVTMLYHRDNPCWSRTYPLPFVRPARTPQSESGRRQRATPQRFFD